MSSKTNKRTGWLRAWFSKVTGGRRRKPRRRPCKLRCEILERRELLSATVVVGAQTFATIPVASDSDTVNGTNYTAIANLAGAISYTSPTQGTVSGTLNGTITSTSATDPGAAFSASVNDIIQTNNVLNGSVNVTAPTAPTNLTGIASLTAGSTFDTSQFTTANTNINWATSSGTTGQWSGIVSSTNTTPFGITLARPYWDSSADTQIDFSFTNTGNWDPVASSAYQTPVTYVNAYWGSGPTTEDGLIGTVPVYWNQAGGSRVD